jgi:hypothetical protein
LVLPRDLAKQKRQPGCRDLEKLVEGLAASARDVMIDIGITE